MAKDFTENFIDLSGRSLSPNHCPELHFNHGVSSLGIRPLVVMRKKGFPIEIVVIPHFLPDTIKFVVRPLATLRIAFEWYIRRSIYCYNSIKVLFAGVLLVSRNFVDIESLSGSIDQVGKLRSVGTFGGSDFNTSDNVGFNSTNQVSLNPLCFASFLTPLMVEPPIISGSGKARRINGKVSFNGSQWGSSLLNERFKKWSQFGILQRAEITGTRRRLSDQSLFLCCFKVRHKASSGHSAVNLIDSTENHISQWESRSTEGLLRLRNTIAKVTKQSDKLFLFMCLRQIIFMPFLSVSYLHGFSFNFRTVRTLLFLDDELNRINMLALFMGSLKVLTSAKWFTIVHTNDISPVTRLGGDLPSQLVPLDCIRFRYCQSSFFPKFHFTSPIPFLFCIYNSIHCMAVSILLGLILREILANISLKCIDNSLRCMVLWWIVNDNVQAKLAELQEKGWTLANIARALKLSPVTVESWNQGKRSPANLHSVLAQLDQLAKRKRIPKQRRYIHGNRLMKEYVNMEKSVNSHNPVNKALVPLSDKVDISPSESLPMYVAKQWGFPLEHQEVDGLDFYCIKDWIAGLTGDRDLRANHIWWNYKKAHKNEGGILSRERVYHGTLGKTYPMDFTNDEGLYKLAMWLRVTQRRTALKAIKTFLAKAGVFVDEARRDPESAAEKLAIERRTRALRDGKSEDWIVTRELGVVTRKQFVARIYGLIRDKTAFGVIIGAITNDVYRGLFESDVSGLRSRLGITSKENPRDHFSRIALAYTTIAEESVKIHLGNYSDRDFVPVSTICDVVNAIAAAIGVQASTIAQALQIDIVSGRKLLEGSPTQGKFESILKNVTQRKLPPASKV